MQKYLVPKEGVLVRDPHSFTPLPVAGALCDWNGNAGRFWRRRVKQGDCFIGEPKKEIKVVEVMQELETTSHKRGRSK